MDKKFHVPVFVGLLAILGLGVMNSLKFFLPPPGARVMTSSLAPVERQIQALQQIESAVDKRGQASLLAEATQVPFAYMAGEYRDPLVSLLPQPTEETMASRGEEKQAPKPAPVAPDMTIEVMLWGGSRPQVLIEGRIYQIGDIVQDSEIVEISREGVTVVSQGTTFVLRPPRRADASAQRPMMEHGR